MKRRWAVVSVGVLSTPGWRRLFWSRKAAERRAHDLNHSEPAYRPGELAFYVTERANSDTPDTPEGKAMSNGQGQMQRAAETLQRWGFKQNPGFQMEWVLSDPDTRSEMFFNFDKFNYDGRLDLGYWDCSVSVYIQSDQGGRLAETTSAQTEEP